MSKKDISNEELARMIAQGFENTATKADVLEIKQDLENLELRMGHLAYAFDVKDLKKRVSVLERKIGTK